MEAASWSAAEEGGRGTVQPPLPTLAPSTDPGSGLHCSLSLFSLLSPSHDVLRFLFGVEVSEDGEVEEARRHGWLFLFSNSLLLSGPGMIKYEHYSTLLC